MKKFLITLCLLIATSFAEVKSQGCLTADMIILIDWSGSEMGNEKELATAARLFVSELPIDTLQLRIGAIIFADEPLDMIPLTGNKFRLLQNLDDLKSTDANGGTQITESIELAGDMLVNERKVSKIIVIISDGEIPDIEDAVESLNYMKETIPLSVYAVHIGAETEENINNLILMTGNSLLVEYTTSHGLVEGLRRLSFCN